MFKSFLSHISTQETPPPWSAWNAISVVLAAFFAVVFAGGLMLALIGDVQYTYLLSWNIAAGLMIGFVYFTRRQPEGRAALRFNPPAPSESSERVATLQSILLLLLIGVGLAIAMDVISLRLTGVALPEPELTRPYVDHFADGFSILFFTWVLAFALMVVLQPISEELVFRGILLPALRRSFGAWPGYLLSAAIYGLFHFMIYSSGSNDSVSIWYSLLIPFIAGLIFGAVRLYTGSTRAAVLTHAAFGLFALIKLLTLVGSG